MMEKSNSQKVIITLDGHVRKFESAHATDVGLVVPCNIFPPKMVSKLSKDIRWIRKRIARAGESYLEALHFHVPLLHFEGKDAKVLRLICDHSPQKERLPHLEQFIILRQHGIHVSKKMLNKSLASFHEHYDSYQVSPFMVKIDRADCGYGFLCWFNIWIDSHSPDPHSLKNLYSLVEKYPDIRFPPRNMVDVFMHLSKEEQEELVHSHTENQVRAMMDSDWCADNTRYLQLHLERVRKNLPLVLFTFETSMPHRRIRTSYVMTIEEAKDFQRIIENLEYDDFLYENIVHLLMYFYLKLGSSAFEDLLQYMQRQDMATFFERKGHTLNIIADSLELQDEIIAIFNHDAELPLSLKLELFDFDDFLRRAQSY